MTEHVPVLLQEVVGLMNVRPGGSYVDATYGRGGHARALLEALGADGRLLAIDRDADAHAHARALANEDSRVTAERAPFSALAAIAARHRFEPDGILFDLGVSTPQLAEPGRGFSFVHDGPLDMRMDVDAPVSAADWLNAAPENEIADVIWRYGEERHSRRIARRIVEARRRAPLKTTRDLAEIVRLSIRGPRQRIDPATRTFQAVRIHVNDELGEIERALDSALALLRLGGRVLVIAFHSLEDRLIKLTFREADRAARDGDVPGRRFRLVTRKPVMVSEEERRANPRARSARLRALERVA